MNEAALDYYKVVRGDEVVFVDEGADLDRLRGQVVSQYAHFEALLRILIEKCVKPSSFEGTKIVIDVLLGRATLGTLVTMARDALKGRGLNEAVALIPRADTDVVRNRNRLAHAHLDVQNGVGRLQKKLTVYEEIDEEKLVSWHAEARTATRQAADALMAVVALNTESG